MVGRRGREMAGEQTGIQAKYPSCGQMARRRYLAFQLQHSRNETHVDGFQTATEVQMHCLRNTRQRQQLSFQVSGRVAKTAAVSLAAAVGRTTKIVVKIGGNNV